MAKLKQTAQTPVAPYFLPHAYSLMLLRLNAGLPCIFWADLYGSCTGSGREPESADIDMDRFRGPMCGGLALPRLLLARRLWAYGAQHDYFKTDPSCVGFTREGHVSRGGGAGLAVLLTNRWEYRSKDMYVGLRHVGEFWTDLLRFCPGEVKIDRRGFGSFYCGPRSVSVWVSKRAAGRGFVDGFVL